MPTTIDDIKAADRNAYNTDDIGGRIICAAGHIAEMFMMPPGKTMRCGIGDVYIRITIEGAVGYNHMGEADANGWNIWDQVFIAPGDAPDTEKGVGCGNRHGGRNTMVMMYNAAIDRMKAEKAQAEAQNS